MTFRKTKTIYFGLVVGAALLILAVPALAADQAVDSDGDGLEDAQEMTVYHTDPLTPDTDGDGFSDGLEVAEGYSPRHGNGQRLLDVDSDQDYLLDGWELASGTDLLNPDTDGDLYLDGTEVAASFDPLNPEPVKLAKKIEVDLSSQKLAYYFGGKLYEEFPISGGVSHMPTPIGEFKVLAKEPVKNYGGTSFNFSYPNTKWNLHFTTKRWRYYIHGAYWHDKFGQPMSHGCVNVDYDPMERLYWWAEIDKPITIKG